ncbi:hypothetical protein UPYG_G00244910 [Umbra pygmaea]|uniref:Uncharacterized protein n=1 Tax=Umbra pygmaea TaxID=75934 RepID=A0ABD0WGA2_UMBPY
MTPFFQPPPQPEAREKPVELDTVTVFSLDTMGEEDTESILTMEQTDEPEMGNHQGTHHQVVQGGQETHTAQTPKRAPPNYIPGVKRKKRQQSNQAPLSEQTTRPAGPRPCYRGPTVAGH